MKIGLLICDRVREKYRAEHGEYPDMYRSLLPPHEFVDYKCYEGELPKGPEECDVWMATGSLHSVYDDIEWIKHLQDFVRKIYDSDRKYIGVCFGHQLLAESVGGKVKKADHGWCVGVHTFDVQSRKEWMQPAQDHYNVIMLCQDQVINLPPNSEVLASSKNCLYGMYLVGDRMLGIQGHPEFSKGYNGALIKDRADRIGYLKSFEGIESLEQSVDGDVLRKWMEHFVDQKLINP